MGTQVADKAAFEDRERRRAREDGHYNVLMQDQQERAEREAAYEERKQRREAAYEERKQRRERHARWLADHPCWLCGECGHTRDSCPLRITSVARDTDASSDFSTVPSLPSSAPSTASTASTAAALPKRIPELPGNCKFCGAKRFEQTKRKAHTNLSKDRCHSCWRAF